MKIAFLNIYQAKINRGAEISTQLLASFLAQKHQVSVLQAGAKQVKKRFNQQVVKLPFLISTHQPKSFLTKILARFYLDTASLKILFFSLKALPQLLQNDFDILIPTNGFWQILVCKLVKLFTQVKIVVFGRSGPGWTDKHNLKLKPDLFISLTSYGEKWARGIAPQVKIAYLPNAINLSFYSKKQKSFFKKELPVILTVAALTPYKQIDLVIKAVAQMKQKAFLLIVGQGELRNELEQLAKKLLGKNFLIKTFSPQLMPRIYQSAQVFTLASQAQDAFPRVLLEALASAKQLVVSDQPIKKEIVGKAGFLVDPRQADLYARFLDQALSQPSVSQKARRQADKYDIKKIGVKLEKILFNLINY